MMSGWGMEHGMMGNWQGNVPSSQRLKIEQARDQAENLRLQF